jgi:hypothetical protein
MLFNCQFKSITSKIIYSSTRNVTDYDGLSVWKSWGDKCGNLMEKMLESCQFEGRERDVRITIIWILGKQVVRKNGL